MNQTYRLNLSAPMPVAKQLGDLLLEIYECQGLEPPALSLFEQKGSDLWGLHAYYPAAPDLTWIKQNLEAHVSPLPPIVLEQMEEIDWVSLVQSELVPVKAGRFFIYGSHDRHRARCFAGDIEVDAGQAFGTAHHGTTRGCLLALDELFKKYRFDHMLDLGTGTGLLAIASARVLRKRVLATDIDPVSIMVARENAALNQVKNHVQFVVADGLKHPSIERAAPFDLIIANILAGPLRALAPSITNQMQPDGKLILSGLLRTQSSSIEACYRARGFRLVKRLPLDEWMTLILQYSG